MQIETSDNGPRQNPLQEFSFTVVYMFHNHRSMMSYWHREFLAKCIQIFPQSAQMHLWWLYPKEAEAQITGRYSCPSPSKSSKNLQEEGFFERSNASSTIPSMPPLSVLSQSASEGAKVLPHVKLCNQNLHGFILFEFMSLNILRNYTGPW